MKKLLLIGSNTIHTYNYYELVKDHFDAIEIITNEIRDGYDLNVHVVDFQLKPFNLIQTPKKINQIISDFNPTVVHIHQANSVAFLSFLAMRKRSIPTVLTAWGSDILVLPNQSLLLNRMVKYNLSRADALTSDSKFMATEMKRLKPQSASILIANFGIGFNPPVGVAKEKIIYSNRLHKSLYRIDAILDAFRVFKLNQLNQDWKLVIAAVGEETDYLKAKVQQENINGVEFVGWVDAQANADWYNRATYWVSIPESDATSISLLEAMACGCIPILSDLPANREWINNLKTGYIVEDTTEDFFSKALNYKYDNAASINRNLIEKEGTKQVNRAKFIDLYNQLTIKK